MVAKAKAKMSARGLVKPVVVDQLVLLVSDLSRSPKFATDKIEKTRKGKYLRCLS